MSFFLRRRRRRFGDLPSSLCCFQPPARISLPDAVRFSRLRAPRFVFIFGMISPVIEERHGSAAALRAYGGMGAMSGPPCLMLSLRAQHDVQHPSFHARVVLRHRDVLHRLHHLLQHLPPELGVRHLAPLEADGDLGLVALLQEPAHVLELEVEVVALGLGAHLHFLDLDRRLLLARLLQPARLRVLVLAEVHDAADGRLGLRRDLDEVELLAARRLQRLRGRHDPELLALRAHHADLAGADAFVDTDLLCLADRRLLDVRDGGCRPRARSAGDGPLGHERPTVRLAARVPISRTRSATTRSTGTAPTSSPVRWRTPTVPASASRPPHTSMYGSLRSCASRMRYPSFSFRSSSSLRTCAARSRPC